MNENLKKNKISLQNLFLINVLKICKKNLIKCKKEKMFDRYVRIPWFDIYFWQSFYLSYFKKYVIKEIIVDMKET